MDLGYYCTLIGTPVSLSNQGVLGGLEETLHFEHVHDVEVKLGFFAIAKHYILQYLL